MSSKHKKKQTQAKSLESKSGGARSEVERLVEKGHLKDAVREAKLYHRQENTSESHRLLERTYSLRAEQLYREGMPNSAREVAQHLLDFGPTDPDLIEPFARLLVAVGMVQEALALQGRSGGPPEARTGLLLAAADQAVLHPERANSVPPETRQGAQAVRVALEALEAGDEAKALAGLREIARGSPFADWRYFVRGLAAYSRREITEARANWDRLDSNRAAARIAKVLLGLSDSLDGQLPSGPALAALEGRVLGGSVLTPLRELSELVTQDRWPEAFRKLREVRVPLRRIDPALPERLTRVLYLSILRKSTRMPYEEGTGLVDQFTRAATPLPIDPHWNRLWALVWERPQGGLDEVERYWGAYLRELNDLPILMPDERPLARALIWTHLGELHIQEVEAIEDLPEVLRSRLGDSADSKTRAEECLKEALLLAPNLREAYERLYRAYDDWDQPEKAEAVATRLLERFPEDLEALTFLARQLSERDEPIRALPFAARARRLKPLDKTIREQEWMALVASARQHARAKRWAEGRDAFEEAQRLDPAASETFACLAKRAIFELKAGQEEAAEIFLQRAEAQLVEPTPLWLNLQIEAVRYGLPKPRRDLYANRLKADLKKKCRSETAGALASTMAAYLSSEVQYTGRATHLKQVVAYLRRTSKVKYRANDLRNVCLLLDHLPEETKLLQRMVHRGLLNYPKDPYFVFMLGELEVRRGPLHGFASLACIHLERALGLARGSNDPKDLALLPRIKERLTMMQEARSGPPGFSFDNPFDNPFDGPAPGPMPGMPNLDDLPPELLDIFEEMCDQMGMDPEEVFEQATESLPPPPGRRGKGSRKRSK